MGEQPECSRVVGCGTILHGREDADSDGSYVATRSIALFGVPVLPLAAYVVRDRGAGGRFFEERVPLSNGARLLRRAVLVAAAASVFACVLFMLAAAGRRQMWVANGLDAAVVVAVDGRAIGDPLPPRSMREVRVELGRRTLSARLESGEVLESVEVVVDGTKSLCLYNVLGRAPAMIHWVMYQAEPESVGKEDRLESTDLRGTSFYQANVDHVMEVPPDEVRAPLHRRTDFRTVFVVDW